MQNYFDLDEFSNKEEENSEEIKNNSPQRNNDIDSSPNIDFSPFYNSSSDKEHKSPGQLIISKNHSINGISDNPINVSSFKINKSYKSENLKICEQNFNLENDNENFQDNKNNNYAEEDNIDISKFDEIKEPAMKFKFNLDNFQKRSIIRLEENKNILVCAHTSSGKTLVAEYGIALGKKNKKKVIYTSPIKALSNQKYCEFKKKFGDVGIITGDVNINPKAQCLVITTEILHKFLYNQSDTLNNVGTVIFDEVHYINDNERGHIWEEILIILPSYISIIMLSATIPNYFEFGCWVGKIKNTKVYIEITKNRVVPLKYFIYIDYEHIYNVKNKEEELNYEEIKNAISYLKKIKALKNNEKNNLNLNKKNNNFENNKINNNSDNENENIIKEEPLSSNSEFDENEGNEINDDEINNEEDNNDNLENNINNDKGNSHFKKYIKMKIIEIVKYILDKKYYPATLFVFNIRKIQDYSRMLIENTSLPELSKDEKEKVNNFFNKAISVIPKEEQNISQINYVKQILQYGVGVHHSGLLPILKEIIEILYFHGLIKILLATTSFSIGLNMPTRTVVFTSLEKYHEGKNQMINSSEFLQMCGRAGRRGIDEFGNIFILYTHPPSKNEEGKLKKILAGQGNDLESKFRLSYRIILSFYHRNLKNIKEFFKESFHESHNIERKPERLKEIKKLKKEINDKNKIKCNKCIVKSKEDQSLLYCKYIDIEDSPIAELICNINKYDSINKKIYNNEKILEYLKNNPGTILQIKNSSNNTINKLHKQDLVMFINILNLKDEKRIWCLTITSFGDNMQNKPNGNSNSNSFNKDKDKDNESKENEIIKDIFKFIKNKGTYKEYKYKYLILNPSDIIEIYEKPKVSNLEQFYKNDKINNFFDITEKGYYYFKVNDKSLYQALKWLYRVIYNNFPKKSNDIQPKNKNSKNRIKNNNHNLELKKVKILDCQKIINMGNENKAVFHEKKKLKEEIKKNCCRQCPLYPNHINIYGEICKIKGKIFEIQSEIIKGEKQETYKIFNKRLDLLMKLNYIQNNDKDIGHSKKSENPNNINNYTDIEEDQFDNYSLTLKGNASLEIITNDSILITELLFSNIFIHNDKILPEEIIVPFLASFSNNCKIKDLKTEKIFLDDTNDSEQIQYLMEQFHEIYKKLDQIEKEYELQESVYNRNFSFKFFNPIYSWMKGDSFCEVCTNHQIVEGKLYTNIMRTFYFVEEISNFYKKIGNVKLVDTFINIKNNLLKGIMSVESLYLKDSINIDDI